MATIQEVAREASAWFETAIRSDGETFTRTKDGTPDWVTDLVRDAHGDLFPDDWRYEVISDACEFIADSDDPEDGSGEFADQAVNVYTHDRFAWLSSNLQRQGYVDEACDEFGASAELGIVERIGWGQYAEASEVFGSVLGSIETEADSRDVDELLA
jgi:hypothetical protein